MNHPLSWQTYFCSILKGSGFFKQKIRHAKGWDILKYWDNIFPGQLEVKKKENESPCEPSFLHLSIDVHYRKFTTKLSDKRDAFSFIPYLDSNIVSKIFSQDNNRPDKYGSTC